jgi:hypothetical protein
VSFTVLEETLLATRLRGRVGARGRLEALAMTTCMRLAVKAGVT